MWTNGITLVNAVRVAGICSIVCAALGPALVSSPNASNVEGLHNLASAAVQYGNDYDERIPLTINGAYRDLLNLHDGKLTKHGTKRADMWPLLILPYLKDRKALIDATRKDSDGIFAGLPLAPGDKGYVATKNTFRNQNRLAFFGMNYMFLSPLSIPYDKMSGNGASDYMRAEPREFFNAFDPHATVFFVPSTRYHLDPGDSRGFSAVNAPGMWPLWAVDFIPYVPFANGTPCSGDWCGKDIDLKKPGVQTSQAAFYEDKATRGNNVAFLDTHVRFLSTLALAAGTDYATAVPKDYGTKTKEGGATLTDKSKYLWNLDDNFYGG